MPAAQPDRWYPSKVDWWIGAAVALGPLACLVALAGAILAGKGIVAALGGVVFLGILYAGIVLPIRYGMTDDTLVVRHGLVRQRIPLAAITEVRPTRSPLSSPALSLDRLRLQFGEGFFKAAMISPADREPFLDELARRAGLRREGDRLVRRA